ncbi:MAG: peptidoglycan editing factor PgeF [Gammaproteobacteria bacterium]|nr:peptidoglycan editing factor PgeF [Gammaproteobacteria bacterium]
MPRPTTDGARPPGLLEPGLTLPGRVRVACTTRDGGYSQAPFDSFNLADHVGDQPDAVRANRARLVEMLQLPAEPSWLRQVHADRVVTLPRTDAGPADGSYTCQPGAVCAVLTADCLSVVLASRTGDEVAVLHCGWRSLLAGIIGNGVACFAARPAELLAWVGPGVSQAAYTVDAAFRDRFINADPGLASAFIDDDNGWRADLRAIAHHQIDAAGIGGRLPDLPLCSVDPANRLYSYRRDGATGRFATLAWIDTA